ncbi:28S ribosomal protein S23, mitochondrial-like isoform X2 [Xenia sp. Carnegie-2017]|uniref:28S ribosomal protein S23, mitochondrial-like isoform X2 n=1 Tax=Xenia sp. Carnegie-2017 TaxID=2897299 RepID=UPI001F04252E|nr:28S ribosomal protein S23, mitochondrial-like isoform X2 [Xenia sp. Carnegie-2017]
MASSRHLKGTVFSRVRDLLKSGVLKEKPVWFDVVAAFPPLQTPDLERIPERGTVEKIVYPEDSIRRRLNSEFQSEPRSLMERSENDQHLSERFISTCLKRMEGGSSESQAFEQTVLEFQDEFKPLKTLPINEQNSEGVNE